VGVERVVGDDPWAGVAAAGPGDFTEDGVYPLPGSWVSDYHVMAAVTSFATQLYGQALIQDTDPSL